MTEQSNKNENSETTSESSSSSGSDSEETTKFEEVSVISEQKTTNTTIMKSEKNINQKKEKEKEKEKEPNLNTFQSNLQISVSKPISRGSGRNKFTSYQIKTKLKDDKEKEFVVTRRYKDFLWLHNNLYEDFPGVVIPILPGKKLISKFKERFVESRRAKFEIFLNRIKVHKLLHSSPYFKQFLEKDVFNIFKSQDNKKKKNKKSNQDNIILNEAYKNINFQPSDLEYIQNVIKRWETIIPFLKEILNESNRFRNEKEIIGNCITRLGGTIQKLKKSEKDNQFRDMENLFSKKIAKIGDLVIGDFETDHLEFNDSIQDHLNLSIAVINSEKTRKSVESKYKIATEYEKYTKGKVDKAKKLKSKSVVAFEKEYKKATKRRKDLKNKTEQISAVFANELKVLQRNQERGISNTFLLFSQAQFTLAKRSTKCWDEIVTKIEEIKI
ncbi:sorting nexin [Anaeramoeba flamelloides]|uniref:Sorting nexin n=1 Tax=Anaeramoeba flamelloides TaxID=1746091 RepID=A0ABQ8X1Q7_9EUKA|nr:sorting nexin [Anaeramoeba flamelloides]